MAKKPPKQSSDKRAALPKSTDRTSEFKKSWDRYNRAGRHDMNEVRKVMVMLFLGQQLPPEYNDHELVGDWEGHRECHIRGDFLLVYKLTKDYVIFTDLGSHSELFG